MRVLREVLNQRLKLVNTQRVALSLERPDPLLKELYRLQRTINSRLKQDGLKRDLTRLLR